MPDAPNAMAAAAAADIAKMLWSAPCREVDDDFNVCAWRDESDPEDVTKITEIIARHWKSREDELLAQLADAEKVVRAAAKWAANSEPRECPWSMNYGCQGDVPCPNLRPREKQAAKCWLECWKKEAGR